MNSTPGPHRGVSPEFLEELRKAIEAAQPETLEDANVILQRLGADYNNTAQEDVGGCSPAQLRILANLDWPDALVAPNPVPTLDDLSGARLFLNARKLLIILHQEAGVKLTPSGNFNRMFSSLLFQEFDIEPSTRESRIKHYRTLNQDDVPYLRAARALLQVSGLIRMRTGKMFAVKKHAHITEETHAYFLYDWLFRTCFQRLDLAAVSARPAFSQLQYRMGYSVYRIGQLADNWIWADEMADQLVLPILWDILPLEPGYERMYMGSHIQMMILRYLADFGLIEYGPEDPRNFRAPFRKTPLFDRIIRFNLPPSIQP